jgi:hypothetical protein
MALPHRSRAAAPRGAPAAGAHAGCSSSK